MNLEQKIEAVADVLAYAEVKRSNPKADNWISGYRAFSEDQRQFLRDLQRTKATAIVNHSAECLVELLALAWDDGAATAWNRSTPNVNAHAYQWRTEGDPANPYRSEA